MSSKCFTTGQNYCHPFVSLLSRMFTHELRVSPGGIHARIPLFHWDYSYFLAVHMFYQCDIRILVFSHGKRKLFLLFSVLCTCEILVKILWDYRVILVKISGDPCENLGNSCVFLVKILCMLADCRGVIPAASALKKSRLESWNRPPPSPWALVLQRFHNITSDNHILSEQITCSLLKPQVFTCACTVEYLAITYV